MTLIIIIIVFMTLLLGFFFFLLFCWAVKDGQYTDTEEAKYMMFREPEDKLENNG